MIERQTGRAKTTTHQMYNTLLLDGRWLLSLREIKAGEEILLTKGWAFYQQANPVAASATEQ